MPDEEKRRLADYIVDTGQGMEAARQAVADIIEKLTGEAARGCVANEAAPALCSSGHADESHPTKRSNSPHSWGRGQANLAAGRRPPHAFLEGEIDSMREIIFDTETTGLDWRDDRVIEIGGIELINRFPTGRTFHLHQPEGRGIDPDALAVHGISTDDLVDKPAFAGIAAEFLEFIDGANLVAHNAAFDMGFINAELARLGQPAIDPDRVVDTLALARRKHPMGPNSLDALCRRYGIDNSHRTKHGALLDSELLAEVYIELIGGKQAALGLESIAARPAGRLEIMAVGDYDPGRPTPLGPRLTEAERAAHAQLVAKIGDKAIWAR